MRNGDARHERAISSSRQADETAKIPENHRTQIAPFQSTRSALLVALPAGALNVFAFAPFGAWPLQIALLAVLFRLVLGAGTVRRAALIGSAYAFGWLAACVHWLYISMHDYGGLPSWMAALAVALLSLALSGFAAASMSGVAWLRQRVSSSETTTALMLLPAAWALAEWLRGWILTGFPWVSSGYAHSNGPLAGYAPLFGVFGIGLIAALIAGALALLPARKWPLIPAALFLGGGFLLKPVAWTTPAGKPISVRLIQGNVGQEMKFAPEQLSETLSLYHDLITAQPADLIATPETAIPMLSRFLPPEYLPLLADFARRSGSSVALGIPLSDGPRQYSNSVIGLVPAGSTYRYDKHHLVPFGEFIPLGARWFVEMMQIPLGDFTAGRLLQPPFRAGEQWVLPNICYEDLFGEEIAAQLAGASNAGFPQATMLLNMSNIAWFGDSIALPQHLQISQMRAMETGRPMLRATNTGMTAVIGPKGEVTAQLPPFTRGVLSADVQGFQGLTPYSRYGNAFTLALTLLLLFTACVFGRKSRAWSKSKSNA